VSAYRVLAPRGAQSRAKRQRTRGQPRREHLTSANERDGVATA